MIELDDNPSSGAGVGSSSLTDRPLNVASVSPLGQGFLFVRSRARVTVDGGHSLLAIRDPATTTRLGPVSTRPDPSDAPNRPMTREEEDAKLMEEIWGTSEPTVSTAPASADGQALAAEWFEATATSTTLVARTISMEGTNARFAPLVRYMQKAAVHGFITIKTLRRHFSKIDPGAFGSTQHAIDLALDEARVAGLVENASGQSVRLVRKATYVFA